MLALTLSVSVPAPMVCLAAGAPAAGAPAAGAPAADSLPDTGSAPTLELLEYLGLMLESEDGELIGPQSLEPNEMVSDEWRSRDSAPTIGAEPSRSFSGDRLFEPEVRDE